MKTNLKLIVLTLIFILTVPFHFGEASGGINVKYTPAKEIKILTGKEAIEDTIRTTLLELGVSKYATELIVAQSKHESGNYNDNSLTRVNNVFARHYAKIDTLAVSGGATAEGHSRFAIYPSIKDATISQYQYLTRKKYSFEWETAYEYAVELKKKRYYEAPISEYTNALNKFIELKK